MRLRWYAGLYLVHLLVLVGIAFLETQPGYMDADYYYASGLRIANDNAWSEPFLWNYLANPEALPQPMFTYWMPLAGVLSGLGISLTGAANFWSGRLLFLLIGAGIAPISAYTGYSLLPRQWAGLLSGGLGIFSGFYLVYLPVTETFSLYMILGALVFLVIQRIQKSADEEIEPAKDNTSSEGNQNSARPNYWLYLAVGGLAGLMYMTRADGLIWLLMVLGAIFLQTIIAAWGAGNGGARRRLMRFTTASLLCFLAFLFVSSPWLVRNWWSFGTVIAPGSSRTLWLTSYDQLFAYPADTLNLKSWLEAGFARLIEARSWALGLNLVTALAVQGGIFLLPLAAAGAWLRRRDWRVQIGLLGWMATFLVMTLVFPFQGARGGFFHAAAGFQVLFWALVPVGLWQFMDWGRRKRGWNPDSGVIKFGIGIVAMTLLVTVSVSYQRLSGASNAVSAWGTKEDAYREVEVALQELGLREDVVVMVNNPPGYYAATGRSAIVIPDGDLSMTLAAANQFYAGYLVLDENFPQGMQPYYENPGNYPGLEYLETIAKMHVYALDGWD